MSTCLIISSDPKNGAINRSVDGSRFTIQFNDPFYLPNNSYGTRLAVISSNIWNVSPNVSTALGNNILEIKDSNGIHRITIDQGLYDLESLFQQITHQFDNIPLTRPVFPFETMCNFQGNDSTGRIYIEFTDLATIANLEFIWSNSTITSLLGFTPTSPTKPTSPSTPDRSFTIVSENFPKFNQYNSFVLHSDIVSEGIPINNNRDNIIAQIPIKAKVAELDNYFRAQEPYLFSTCDNLIGQQNQIYSMTFWITSETGVPLDQAGEYFDFVLLLSWLE